VVLTNKTQDKDLKVWYRLGAKATCAPASLNLALPVSTRKTYLYAKNQKIIETFVKIDPSKPFFFAKMEDIQVELEAVVRNDDGPQAKTSDSKRVDYSGQQDAGVGGGPQDSNNDYDEDDRGDDEMNYMQY
jgi:hypothetical protein